MRVVVQRVSRASVRVNGQTVGSIGRGYLLLVGVEPSDSSSEVSAAVSKLAGLRLFADEHGKMNLAIGEVDGSMLVVSQFTLLGDARKGRRPSFVGAAPPAHADRLIGDLVDSLRRVGVTTETGVFGAQMEVDLVNEGPVTLVLEFREGRLV